MDEITLSYLAGVIDSDGAISIGVDRKNREAKSPRFFETIGCGQCETEAVYLLRETFGGNICRRLGRSERSRPMYVWGISNAAAAKAAAALAPYLRIKKRQAEILAELRAVKARERIANTDLTEEKVVYPGRWPGRGWPRRQRFLKPEVLKEYERLTSEIRSLNHPSH